MADSTAARAAAPQVDAKALDRDFRKAVRGSIRGSKFVENNSKTYTRIQAADGQTFGYVFPPRGKGLAVKIPKQLLSVEPLLPKTGLTWKAGNWGLTTVIATEAQIEAATEAFSVAAAALAPRKLQATKERKPAKATEATPAPEPVETLPPSKSLATAEEVDAEIAEREQARETRKQEAPKPEPQAKPERQAKPDPKAPPAKKAPAKKRAKRQSNVQALVESGLADSSADAKAQLADMGLGR